MDRYAALALYLQACANTPFQWAKHDCCTFAADGVRVMTGRDPMEHLRGLYDDQLSASRILAAGGGMLRVVSQTLGLPTPVATLQRGDVVLYNAPEFGPTLGLCFGEVFAGPGRDGLVYLKMKHARKGWKV